MISELKPYLEQYRGELVPRTPEAEAERLQRIEHEHAREQASFATHLLAWGVGETTASVHAEAARDTGAMRVVAEWLETRETFLALLGRAGCGKTVAAVSVLDRARVTWDEDGVTRWRYGPSKGMFARARDLTRSMHQDGVLLERATSVAWLVLDDLGAEYSDQGQRWLTELDALLDARHEGRRRTVITSNLTPDQFKTRYGERIASRVRGGGRVVDCGAIDLRRGT